MKLWCLPFTHDYTCIETSHYLDVSYATRAGKGSKSTKICYRCNNCGKLKVVCEFGAGWLTKEQVNGPKEAPVRIVGYIPLPNKKSAKEPPRKV